MTDTKPDVYEEILKLEKEIKSREDRLKELKDIDRQDLLEDIQEAYDDYKEAGSRLSRLVTAYHKEYSKKYSSFTDVVRFPASLFQL